MKRFNIFIEAHRKHDHLLYHHYTEVNDWEEVYKIATLDLQKLMMEDWLIGKLDIKEVEE